MPHPRRPPKMRRAEAKAAVLRTPSQERQPQGKTISKRAHHRARPPWIHQQRKRPLQIWCMSSYEKPSDQRST